MARIELISVPYSGRSIISSGQESVNLYAEVNATNDPQAPSKTTYYPTPGSVLYASPSIIKKARGAYHTSIGTAFYVVGQNVYFLTSVQTLIFIGAIADRQSQVYFVDNGLVCVLVDGLNGYVIDLPTNTIDIIVDPNFYPADFVTLLDTFLIFNRAGTNQFFISASNPTFGMLSSSGILSGNISAAGAGYVNGTYSNVPLTGGSGLRAIANITVAGGVVTNVAITGTGDGYNYLVGDVLSANNANLGGAGAGFTYTVTALESAFNALDIAAKAGFNDPIVGILSVHRELWLVGSFTTEVWINTGAADFTFQEQQGAYINHGCAAQYSLATMDVLTFFIMQDQQGTGIVVQGQGYDLTEISTPRLVSEFKNYANLTDAIGFCFQEADHAFYALVFPTANKGWLYDITSSNASGQKQWSEWNWTDSNGTLNRPRANCFMFAYGSLLVGDWETGDLLKLSVETFTDYTSANATNSNGSTGPISCIRTFPHSNDNNDRSTTLSFDADMQVGTILDASDPQISLSWSDNKGVSYGNPVMQSLGMTGEYLTVATWNRLGQARDRVYKLFWAANAKTALNGGFIERKKART